MEHKILLGELKAFRRFATTELKALRSDVNKLNKFQVKVMSLSAVATFIGAMIIELLRK